MRVDAYPFWAKTRAAAWMMSSFRLGTAFRGTVESLDDLFVNTDRSVIYLQLSFSLQSLLLAREMILTSIRK
jgi:hypothetical protein